MQPYQQQLAGHMQQMIAPEQSQAPNETSEAPAMPMQHTVGMYHDPNDSQLQQQVAPIDSNYFAAAQNMGGVLVPPHPHQYEPQHQVGFPSAGPYMQNVAPMQPHAQLERPSDMVPGLLPKTDQTLPEQALAESKEALMPQNDVQTNEEKEESKAVDAVKEEVQPAEAPAGEEAEDEEMKDDTPLKPHQIYANVLQISVLNKMLPKGYKFDLLELVERQMELQRKKTVGLANYQRPEIQNEIKMQKIYQKYLQKRERERLKLEANQASMQPKQQQSAQPTEVVAPASNKDLYSSAPRPAPVKQEPQYQGESAASPGVMISQQQPVQAPQRIGGTSKQATVTNPPTSFNNNNMKQIVQRQGSPSEKAEKPAASIEVQAETGGEPRQKRKYTRRAPLQSSVPGKKEQANSDITVDQRSDQGDKRACSFENVRDSYRLDSLAKLIRERRVEPAPGYRTRIFKNLNFDQFTLYDKYTRLLEALICRSSSREGGPVAFLSGPPEQGNRSDEDWAKLQRELANENDGDGYLNFADILQRMRNKKYGPGKNSMKQNMLLKNIRSVFRICETYFGDLQSMKEKHDLEVFFESEFSVAPLVVDGVNNGKFFFPDHDGKVSGDEDDDDDRRSRKKKKKEKRDKSERDKSVKGKKKTHKRRHERGDSDADDDGPRKRRKKSSDENDLKRGGSSDDNDHSDDAQYAVKQEIRDIIVSKLTEQQKMGIIPIVFADADASKDGTRKKFEFDLFAIDAATFAKLEKYVRACAKSNETGPAAQPAQSKEEPAKDVAVKDEKQANAQVQAQSSATVKKEAEPAPNTAEQGKKADETVKEINEPPKWFDLSDPSQLKFPYDRTLLIEKMHKLNKAQLRGVAPIVQENLPADQAQMQQSLEFDLNELSEARCCELHNYCQRCIDETRKVQEQQEKLNLCAQIKTIDGYLAQVLGFLTTRPEFQQIGADENEQEQIKRSNNTIELDLEQMNIEKVRYLQQFLRSPELQDKYKELMMVQQREQLQAAAQKLVDEFDEAAYLQEKQASQHMIQQHEEIYTANGAQIDEQMEEQQAQLDQTRMLMKQLQQSAAPVDGQPIDQGMALIQGMSQEERERMYLQTVENESILTSNIQSLFEFKERETNKYYQHQIQLRQEMAERDAKYQEWQQRKAELEQVKKENALNAAARAASLANEEQAKKAASVAALAQVAAGANAPAADAEPGKPAPAKEEKAPVAADPVKGANDPASTKQPGETKRGRPKGTTRKNMAAKAAAASGQDAPTTEPADGKPAEEPPQKKKRGPRKKKDVEGAEEATKGAAKAEAGNAAAPAHTTGVAATNPPKAPVAPIQAPAAAQKQEPTQAQPPVKPPQQLEKKASGPIAPTVPPQQQQHSDAEAEKEMRLQRERALQQKQQIEGEKQRQQVANEIENQIAAQQAQQQIQQQQAVQHQQQQQAPPEQQQQVNHQQQMQQQQLDEQAALQQQQHEQQLQQQMMQQQQQTAQQQQQHQQHQVSDGNNYVDYSQMQQVQQVEQQHQISADAYHQQQQQQHHMANGTGGTAQMPQDEVNGQAGFEQQQQDPRTIQLEELVRSYNLITQQLEPNIQDLQKLQTVIMQVQQQVQQISSCQDADQSNTANWQMLEQQKSALIQEHNQMQQEMMRWQHGIDELIQKRQELEQSIAELQGLQLPEQMMAAQQIQQNAAPDQQQMQDMQHAMAAQAEASTTHMQQQ